jgi:ubiquinone biosynthesis protein
MAFSSQEPTSTSPDRTGDNIFGRLSEGSQSEFRREFNLTRTTRRRRMHEIFRIMRHNKMFSSQITPATLRTTFEELGPTFVKMGQILSMRSEILPQRYCDELTLLRSDVEPMPFDLVIDTLEREYRRPIGEIFASIDSHPLGSASLAQVHRAKLLDGTDVAIKVQRPGVQETMAQDIDILRTMARRLKRFFKNDQFIDISDVVEEMWVSFREEVDFLAEARNLEEFHENNARCVYLDCPKPYLNLCTGHIVVMDFVDGISLENADELVKQGYDLGEIGVKLVDNYATQVLDDGFFHADPHPGNIIISGGKIMYIDLGMVGRLSAYNRSCMSDIISAVGEGSSTKLKDALLRFAVSKDISSIDHAEFLADLDFIVAQFGSVSLQDLDLGSLLFSLISLARKYRVELPSTITMMARGLVTLEGVLDAFMPDTNMIEIIKDHIKRSTSMTAFASNEMRDLLAEGRQATHSMLKAAGELSDLTHMLTRGQLKVNMEMQSSTNQLDKMSHIVDRLTLGIIIAGLFIGSSVVYFADIQPVIFGIPVLGFLGYVGAAILSIFVIVGILRKPKQ